jgi:hypothetical protein
MKPCFSKSLTPFCLFLALITLLVSCSREEVRPTPAPVITSIDPKQGAPGATVVIRGRHFSTKKEENHVRFQSVPATVLSASAGELAVLVPEGAASGVVSVTIGDHSATSSEEFTVNAAAPLISSVSPGKGDPGTLVEVTGDNFSAGATVLFGNLPASEVTVVSKTKLTAKVPAGVLTNFIKVVSNDLEGVSPQPFYARPLIVSLSPVSAREGEEVTIQGANFSTVAGENVVSFGSVAVPQSDIIAATATTLKVKAPVTLSSQKVIVSVQGMVSNESPQTFTLLPTIAGYSPASGAAGTVVTITGKNLSPTAQVLLGTTAITQFEGGRSTEQIAFKIPAGALSGTIVLKQEEQTVEIGAFQVTSVLQPDTWTKMKSYLPSQMPRLNIHQGINFMHDNKIFIGYGYSNLIMLTYSNELTALDVNSATNTVVHADAATAAGRPSQRVVATYAKLGSKVYLFGGGNNSSTANEIWEYDIVANSYTKKATVLPNANHVYNAFVYNGTIYLYIYRVGATGAEIFKYDPDTDALTLYANFGGLPFWSGFTVEVVGDLAYFIGGSDSKLVKVLDLKNKTRLANIAIPNLATPNIMGNIIHFVKGGKIYFGGGWDGINTQPVTDFYVFDPGARTLTQLADIPQLHPSYAPPFGVKDGVLYVLTAEGIYNYMP